ncbi:protein EMBRYONIC FLOWER 1 [Senna tora]|uniref:Protein EMBRYONIC FLOWER 1 n=1 Tax=Senna tora TaxID=362788 RepID=A0A834T797_9FABA|nr:protein EMBRYONIC FLOWER 1 [Senna tora]
MGSFIQIDSISIDLANSIDQTDAGNCEHFSIRGYVSEIRKKDWKKCWPFPLEGNRALDIPKFRWWCCHNCQREIAAEGSDKDDQNEFNCCSTGCRSASKCSKIALIRSDIQLQLTPTPDSLERREIDLNSSTNLSCENECLPANYEKEKKAEVANSRIIDREAGLGDNLDNQITSVPPPEVYSRIPEVPTIQRGFESNEVSDVEFVTSNTKCVAKYSSEIYNEGTHISAYGQCQKELNKTCALLPESTVVAVADDTTYRKTGHPPIESDSCQLPGPGITETLVENDIQDHHLEKASGLPRRRPRKVRLLTDLLSENVETKTTEKFTVQRSQSDGTSNAPAALQTESIFRGKLDVQGDLTNMGKSRKRKFLQDEGQKSAEMCSLGFESEVQNLEGDAEVNDTILDTGSEAKSYGIKPEIERSHTILSKKKNKKIQVVDSHLIPLPYQNEENVDVMSEAYASKTLSSRLAPCALKEKGMDSFPWHAPGTEKECNLSKRKGKMLQVDGELASLSCWKNDMPVEDSFALPGAKVMSNMPVATPISSAQGSMKEKGVEEGLQLSLSSFLGAQVYKKNCIHQIENKPPFSLSLQEGTSKIHQLIRPDCKTTDVGGPSIPYRHITDSISEKGVHCEEINGARKTEKIAEGLVKANIMKNNGDQTANDVSEQEIADDIPMEIVELMAKNQYERRLSDAENSRRQPQKSTIRRNARVTVGTAIYGKEEISLLQEGQKEKHRGRHGKNGMIVRGENARPDKRKSVHYFSAFDGNQLNMNRLCQPQSSFGFEVSHSLKRMPSGFHFSPMASSQLGNARNFNLNVSTTEHRSSDATLQGGCSLHKTILHQGDEASHIWASLTPNHVSLGYDRPKKVVSHSPRTITDITSLQSGTLHKQNKNRDIDLNCLNLNPTGLEKLNRNIGPETFSKMNAEYQFPNKNKRIEPQQNMRGSLDLYSNETIPAMHLLSLMDAGMKSSKPFNASVSDQMLNRPSYPGDCNSKLEIGTSKALASLKRTSSGYYNLSYVSHKHDPFLSSPNLGASSPVRYKKKSTRATNFNSQISSKSGRKKMKSSDSVMQNKKKKQFSWPCLETETPQQRKLEVHSARGTLKLLKSSCVSNSCSINRNPAEFTMPEMGNVYMIRGEDLKFEKASIPIKRPSLLTLQGCKQQRNLKRTKIKEHAKH